MITKESYRDGTNQDFKSNKPEIKEFIPKWDFKKTPFERKVEAYYSNNDYTKTYCEENKNHTSKGCLQKDFYQ